MTGFTENVNGQEKLGMVVILVVASVYSFNVAKLETSCVPVEDQL